MVGLAVGFFVGCSFTGERDGVGSGGCRVTGAVGSGSRSSACGIGGGDGGKGGGGTAGGLGGLGGSLTGGL